MFERDQTVQSVEASQADDALSQTRIVLPDQYRFTAGYSIPPPFSGSFSYYLRYDQPEKVDLHLLAEMNSDREFGPVMQTNCGSELSKYSLVTKIGLHCEGLAPLLVIRNDGGAAGNIVQGGKQLIIARVGDDSNQIYIISEGL